MFLLAKIVLHYVNGEEIWKCDACGKKVYAELVEDFYNDEADRCPRCGEEIDDIEEN